jgi:hypothetical protein
MRPRVGPNRSGKHRPGDASSRGWKVNELSIGDTSVGDTHTHRHDIKRGKVLVLLNGKDAIYTFRKIKYRNVRRFWIELYK